MRFSVSCFIFWSLTRLDLSFVQRNKYGSIWILLHSDIQFDHHHLLKKLSFFPVCIFGFFVKIQVSVSEWNCLGLQFGSIDDISICMLIPCCFYYYSSVLVPEIRHGDTSRSSVTA